MDFKESAVLQAEIEAVTREAVKAAMESSAFIESVSYIRNPGEADLYLIRGKYTEARLRAVSEKAESLFDKSGRQYEALRQQALSAASSAAGVGRVLLLLEQLKDAFTEGREADIISRRESLAACLEEMKGGERTCRKERIK